MQKSAKKTRRPLLTFVQILLALCLILTAIVLIKDSQEKTDVLELYSGFSDAYNCRPTAPEKESDTIAEREIAKAEPSPTFVVEQGEQSSLPDGGGGVIYTFVPPEQDTQGKYKDLLNIDFETLSFEYPDMVGWVQIDDTIVDFPIVMGTTNEEYLDTNPDGKYYKAGSIFMDFRVDFEESRNFIIYGHNMNYSRGPMFSRLPLYLTKSYAEKHQDVKVNINGENFLYRVFAVKKFNLRDENAYEDHFRTTFNTKAEFDEYVAALTKTSGVALDIEFTPTKILSLCTCIRTGGSSKERLMVFAAQVH